jgi:MinD superfamily P-loop ATPase
MRIAIASGKGGTGKTTVAASLALSLARAAPGGGPAPLFLDCDVEAPNAHLFLEPAIAERRPAGILIPQVDEARCSRCGRCAEVCQYHAIAVLGKAVLVFPQLCHGCGSCARQCPEAAISEKLEITGAIERGAARDGLAFARGVMDVGQPMAVPVIRELKHWAAPQPGQTVILDAAPGASCPVVEAARGADCLLLVTEPTPFGLHDLRLAAGVARALGIPAGVVVNRDGIGDAGVDAFCAAENLPILMRIPYERRIAEGVARGRTLVDIHPEYAPRFLELRAQARALAATGQMP